MRPDLRRIAPIAMIAVVAVVTLIVWLRGRDATGVIEASGTVEATEAELGFTVTGRLDSLAAGEGDVTQAGEELAWLDRAEMNARLGQVRAQVKSARAMLLELERGPRPEEIEQARAASEASEDRRVDAERDLERARTLVQSGALSQEALDKASLAYQVARSQATQARESYRIAETGTRAERIAAQRASVEQAVASLRQIEATLDNMVARAPFAGVVTAKHREIGEIAPAGSPVLTVRNRADRWVRIYVAERHIGSVRLGQRASIRTDSDPKKSFAGEVTYVPTQAEFTPRSVQTKEERVRLVYAVKVRIADDPAFELKPGMPADVRLTSVPP